MQYNSFITNWIKNKQKLVKNHVYDELNEHSSCGVGLIASLKGVPKREVVEMGIEALKVLYHRGAVDADGKTGDGAGIHIEIPNDFFAEKIEITGHEHDNSDLCVGMIFLPRNDFGGQEQCRSIVESELTKKNFNIYGWRQVPVESKVLGYKAELTRPEITQVLFKSNDKEIKNKDYRNLSNFLLFKLQFQNNEFDVCAIFYNKFKNVFFVFTIFFR